MWETETSVLRSTRHADTHKLALVRCRGVRRIVHCLNMLLRVQALDEQYLATVQHGSLLRANLAKQTQNTLRKEKRKMATYKERYLAGEIEFEEIDNYSYQWGMSDDERTLAQYLGLNAEEEDAWVSISEEALKELLDKQRKKK